MNINKEMIQKAVDKALDEVLTVQDKIENSDDVVDTTNLEEMVEKENEESTVDNIDTPSEPTNEKVEEKVEEAINEQPNFNFLGLDIEINQNGDMFDVTIKKDDKEKTESVDSAELPIILGLIEDFFNELVVDEDVVEDTEESEDENLDEENPFDESDESDEADEAEESEEDEEDEDDEEEEEDKDSDLIHPSATMSSLRRKYKDKVNEIFEHGLLAKELAFEMVKEKLVASTVKELVEKTKEKDAIIAAKRDELKTASLKYLVAKKLDNQYKKAYSLLSSAIDEVKVNLTENKIDTATANKILNNYKILLSKVVEAKKVESIVAAIEKTGKIKQAVVASTITKKQIEKKENNVTKKEIKNVTRPVNVLNRTGWKDNSTILAKRHEGIEEMSAEILRIARVESE